MDHAQYVRRYISECAKEAGNPDNPPFIKHFFEKFGAGIEERVASASKGDRNIIATPFSDALKHIFPGVVPQARFGSIFNLSGEGATEKNFKNKSVDFKIDGAAATLLIEFKSTLTFNDVSAAIVEMALAKKFAAKYNFGMRLSTASLHLYPSADIRMINEVNSMMGAPLDRIWVLCKKPRASVPYEFYFDIGKIIMMMEDIDLLLGQIGE